MKIGQNFFGIKLMITLVSSQKSLPPKHFSRQCMILYNSLVSSDVRTVLLVPVVCFTLGAEMFGLSDFWLETRVIIKISTHP